MTSKLEQQHLQRNRESKPKFAKTSTLCGPYLLYLRYSQPKGYMEGALGHLFVAGIPHFPGFFCLLEEKKWQVFLAKDYMSISNTFGKLHSDISPGVNSNCWP